MDKSVRRLRLGRTDYLAYLVDIDLVRKLCPKNDPCLWKLSPDRLCSLYTGSFGIWISSIDRSGCLLDRQPDGRLAVVRLYHRNAIGKFIPYQVAQIAPLRFVVFGDKNGHCLGS